MKAECPKCEVSYKINKEYIGEKTNCWRCGEWYIIAEGRGILLRQKKQTDKEQKTAIKGRVQIGIGVFACILLLFGVGAEILSVYTEYSIMNNREPLIELGYNPDSFTRATSYWVTRYSFHFYGLTSLLLYLIFTQAKKLKAATVVFTLCFVYFLICAIISITNLTPEQKMRGYTIGGWIAKIIVWLPKYTIELGLLVQGLLGVRKYHKTSKDTIGLVQDEEKKPENAENVF